MLKKSYFCAFKKSRVRVKGFCPRQGKINEEPMVCQKMKKFFVLLFGLMTLNAFAFNDRPVTFQQLPQKAQQFINTHFKGVEFLSATVDDDYEVYLANGTKVEFTLQGEWKEVKCPGSAVPTAIVPAAITKYVKAQFPNSTIVKIDKKYGGYDVELNNDMELKFDKNGKFLSYDD